jgi:predicted cupin superfamily sugar epimerase
LYLLLGCVIKSAVLIEEREVMENTRISASGQAMIDRLDLVRHPEGGWYRETWRDAAVNGARAMGSAILFLLDAGEWSHWHRVDATELWLFQAGDPLVLRTAAGAEGELGCTSVRLGPDPLAGDRLQHVVQPGEWQAARAGEGWSLVACVVVPAFEFAGFELASVEWEPRGFLAEKR